MNITDIARRIWQTFAQSRPPLRENFHRLLEQGNIPPKDAIIYFSVFDKQHKAAVESMLDRFYEILKSHQDIMDGASAVLDEFDQLLPYNNPDLLFFSLGVFLNSISSRLAFKLPSIFVQQPENTVPSFEISDGPRFEVAVGSDDESKMDWFREDPMLNEHHGHWHLVYFGGKDRQGEMFFSMHRQMLVRYRADRLGMGVPDLTPFDDFTKPISVGYVFGLDQRLGNLYKIRREPGAKVDANDAVTQLSHLAAIHKAINDEDFDPDDQTSMGEEIAALDKLGGTIEANGAGIDASFNNYHGNGHGYIANINGGVMGHTDTAVRDVVFWEWHLSIDDIYQRWIDRLDPHQFFTDAPNIVIRKSTQGETLHSPDIIICKTSEIEGYSLAKGKQIGNMAFGGGNWDTDFTNTDGSYTDEQGNVRKIRTTNQLLTEKKQDEINYLFKGQPKSYRYRYLNHDPFCYFIRIQNPAMEVKQVTVRIFIVPEQWAEEQRLWIEMDKFLVDLPPNSKYVIFRADEEASVVKKPAAKTPADFEKDFTPVDMGLDEEACKCGWPYHMLLPAGGPLGDGIAFRLMVMITDNDLVGREPNCGSLSFCGSTDDRYPDKRPQGYPFNRRFKGAIADAILQNRNMAARQLFIKHIM